jgi:hypothetical protein
LLEQKMGHDGGPLIVGALEFVLETREIAVLDWGASDGETQTWCGRCLTRSHIWGFALACYQSHIERVTALLQHLDDDGVPAAMGRLDRHDVAASHGSNGVHKLDGTAELGKGAESVRFEMVLRARLVDVARASWTRYQAFHAVGKDIERVSCTTST